MEFTGFNQELFAEANRKSAPAAGRRAAEACGAHSRRSDAVLVRLAPGLGRTACRSWGLAALEGLSLATGHGHLGWSMAAGTGKALAQQLLGEPQDFPLAGYALSRFGSIH